MKQLLAILLLAAPALNAPLFAQQTINVVPKPNSVVMGKGSFAFSSATAIESTPGLDSLTKYLSSQLRFFTGIAPVVHRHARRDGTDIISVSIDRRFSEQTPGAYALQVSPDGIHIKARSEIGLFHGIQTLLQLIPLPDSSVSTTFEIPFCSIMDYPRFQWRGLNLDCVRHFMTIDFIKRYINLLAYYKFDVFHWHLTDDQGWRIEIKKYPLLTKIGAWRTEPDGSLYGGFYTQEQMKEIVAYAKSRFISVVPEIEMPGHCEASLASYPENACVPGPFQVGTQWGVYKDIYNPGKESTFAFLENVFDEVLNLFPSHYIHIGGDEVPKMEWKENALCQKLMKEKGLKNEDELQSYFIRTIQKFLESKGRQIIGWDEILEGKGPDSGGVVESWRGIDGAITGAISGHYTILAPGGYTYLSQDADGLRLDTVYSFDPMPPQLTQVQQKSVLGTEASMWTEHAPQETVDGKMFPRLLAIAEDAWTEPAKKNYADFHRRLQVQYDRLAYLGVDYGLEQKAISYHTTFDGRKKEFTVSLAPTQAGIKLRYTIGDTLTMENSHAYEESVAISGTETFIAQAEMNGRLVGNPVKLSFMMDKALNSDATVKEQYAPQYAANGAESLVDGIRGTMNFRDGLWQGYQGTDIDATIDLKEIKNISEVGAGFYQDESSYIFMPTNVEFFVSRDGKNFESVGVAENDVSPKDPDTITKDFAVTFKPREVRYVRMVAKSIGVCPPWHPGAGAKAWLFIDEIFAN